MMAIMMVIMKHLEINSVTLMETMKVINSVISLDLMKLMEIMMGI